MNASVSGDSLKYKGMRVMKDFKRCFKLIKYCYNYKDETYTSVVLFILGIVSFFVGFQDSLVMGSSLFLVLMPVAFIKALFNLPYSYMVCSSRKRKLIELTFPNVWTVVATCLGYLIWILLIKGFVLTGVPEWEAEVAKWIMWSSLFHVVMHIFLGVCTRLYWQSIMVLVPVMMFFILAPILWKEAFAGFTEFEPAAGIGFVITLAGAIVACILRVLVYKLPLVRGSVGKKMLTNM